MTNIPGTLVRQWSGDNSEICTRLLGRVLSGPGFSELPREGVFLKGAGVVFPTLFGQEWLDLVFELIRTVDQRTAQYFASVSDPMLIAGNKLKVICHLMILGNKKELFDCKEAAVATYLISQIREFESSYLHRRHYSYVMSCGSVFWWDWSMGYWWVVRDVDKDVCPCYDYVPRLTIVKDKFVDTPVTIGHYYCAKLSERIERLRDQPISPGEFNTRVELMAEMKGRIKKLWEIVTRYGNLVEPREGVDGWRPFIERHHSSFARLW